MKLVSLMSVLLNEVQTCVVSLEEPDAQASTQVLVKDEHA